MNRKTFIILSCVLIVIGIVLCTSAIAISGLDFSKLSTTKYQFKTKSIPASDISSLRVDLVSNDIRIVFGEDEQFKISYYEEETENYQIHTVGNSLVIGKTEQYNWIKHIGINFIPKAFDILVEIPQNFDGGIDVKLVNGSITLKNLALGTINAKLTNGDITCENVVVSSAKVENRNGDIEIIAATGQEIYCSTVNGDVELTASRFDNFDLKTTNGDIEGTISGLKSEYTINTKTTFGDSNLHNNTAASGKTFTAKSVSGDIDIEFDR